MHVSKLGCAKEWKRIRKIYHVYWHQSLTKDTGRQYRLDRGILDWTLLWQCLSALHGTVVVQSIRTASIFCDHAKAKPSKKGEGN